MECSLVLAVFTSVWQIRFIIFQGDPAPGMEYIKLSSPEPVGEALFSNTSGSNSSTPTTFAMLLKKCFFNIQNKKPYPQSLKLTRGPMDLISCTLVLLASFVDGLAWSFVEDLSTCFLSSFVQQWRSRKSLSQSEAKVATFVDGQPKKKPHRISQGCWVPASCQVSLISARLFQRIRQKYLRQAEARTAIFVDRSAQKTQT